MQEREREWQAHLAAVTPYWVGVMLAGKGAPDFDTYVLKQGEQKKKFDAKALVAKVLNDD